MSRQPSSQTLLAMYGEDSPIGSFATDRYNESLMSCHTVADYVKTIIDYAIELHKAQSEYECVSPYGGLDIEVEPVDRIALREAQRVSKAISNDVRSAVIEAMVMKGVNFADCKNVIKRFETMQHRANGALKTEFDKWRSDEKELHDEIFDAVDFIKKEGERLYNIALSEEIAFKNKSWLYQKMHKDEYRDIQQRKEDAALQSVADEQSPQIAEKFSSRIENHLYNTPHILQKNEIGEFEIKYIDTEDVLKEVVDEAKIYCNKPENIKNYRDAVGVLTKAETLKTPVFIDANDSR